jgi:hypothetical protein
MPEGSFLFAAFRGAAYPGHPRVEAALEELSEALADEAGSEVSGFKLFGGLFGGGSDEPKDPKIVRDSNGEVVKVVIPSGSSCNPLNLFMDPGNGADLLPGAPRF